MARADIGLSDVTIGEILLRQNKPTEALQQIRDGLANFPKIQPIEGILERTGESVVRKCQSKHMVDTLNPQPA